MNKCITCGGETIFSKEGFLDCIDCNTHFILSDDIITMSRVIVCSICGNPNVVAVNFTANLSFCAVCMPPLKGHKEKFIGCKKCEYTGYSYGSIPCECMEILE